MRHMRLLVVCPGWIKPAEVSSAASAPTLQSSADFNRDIVWPGATHGLFLRQTPGDDAITKLFIKTTTGL